MGNPVTLDFSKAVPIGDQSGAQDDLGQTASDLRKSVSYGASQNPDQYAKLLQMQKQTGVPPQVAQGNESEVQQSADVNSLDYAMFVAHHPLTTKWASNPDNAAVSGADEIHRLGNIESSAASIRAATPWESFENNYLAPLRQKLMEFPLTRMGVDAVGGAAGLVGDVGSFLGWHGDGASEENAPQRLESYLSPANANLNINGRADTGNTMDAVVKNVAPMIPITLATGGTGLIARTLGLSANAAKVLTGLSISALFTADQGGSTYTQMKKAGASDYDARLAANRVSLMNAPLNAAFGMTDLVPFLKRNPLATSMVLGGAQGATGQLAQNSITNKPLSDNLLTSALQGFAVQGGFHLGTGFFEDMANIVTSAEQSKLKARSPEKFQEALSQIFDGQQSLRIPAEQFETYFQGKNIDPMQVAQQLGVTNYAEAKLAGSDVEISPADFVGKLDHEHQKGLLGDVVNPSTGMTLNEQRDGEAELQKWVASGGPEKLSADTAQADAETQSSDEYQSVKSQLQKQYTDAGETPQIAENYATLQANVYSNLARETGMTPSELMGLYRPVMRIGEAPETALQQSTPDEQPRGWFRTLPDGSFEIGKTNIGDLSTFVHEPAHSYLEMLGGLSTREGASEGLKSDYGKILDFLGAKDGEAITTEQHEKWARANEQYLREGKAPSQSLKGVFQRFAVWLSSIYKRASDLGVGLSDDIRGVFDRLYAAEDGVNRAEKESGPKLFSTPEEAGWTDEQFKNYAESRGTEVEQAKSEILSKLNEAAVRERSESWREEETNVREAVTTEIDQKPEYQAIRALRKGELSDGTELKLNRDELVKQFGEERVKELQKQHPGMYRNEGGTDAETAAEILGFGSGEGMVRAMEAAPRRSQAIAQATRDYMTSKHGDIRYDGTLDDQARLALEGDRKASNLHRELSALRKKVADLKENAADRKAALRSSSEATAPLEIYRTAANRMIEDKPLADLNPHRYLEASRKHSREALDAISKGKVDEAIQSKHKELMNHFLYREAVKAKQFVGKFESYVQKAQSPKVQQKLGLAGGDYRDQYNRILGRYGLGPKIGAGRTLAQWAEAQHGDGEDPAIDQSILNEERTINYRNASVAEIRAVNDALKNIQHLASQQLKRMVHGNAVEFESAKSEMIDRARENNHSKQMPVLDHESAVARLGRQVLGVGVANTRMEFLINKLDGGTEGPWHDYLWNLYETSKGKEFQLQADVTRNLADQVKDEAERQGMRLQDKVSVPGIPGSESPTRKDLISMALNMGNEGNLDRLQRTFMSHGWEPSAIERLKDGVLTREEWTHVQNIWEALKPLGKEMNEAELRRTGLSPVMVEPTPFEVKTSDGTGMSLGGGYFPITMNPDYSQRGAEGDSADIIRNLTERGYTRAQTSRGYTKERIGFGGPLLLDYERVLSSHIAKVTKDISHRDFMLAANKLLMDQDIRQTLRETLGPDHESQFLPWLRATVNDRNGSLDFGRSDPRTLMEHLRSNLVTAALAMKVSVNVLQFTHIARILEFTKAGSLTSSMVDFWKNPIDMTQQIRELSPNEMRFRGDNLDRDYRAKLQELAGKKNISAAAVRFGYSTFRYIDHVISFPLWHSVYNDALQSHADLSGSEANELAMHAADAAVRMGIGTGTKGDLPPIMRSDDFWLKMETMLFGFHNLNYNILVHKVGGDFTRTGFQGNRSIASYGKLTAGLATAWIIPALISSYVQGDRPKDGENIGLWAAKRSLLFGAGTIPYLKDAASLLDRGSLNPMVTWAERQAKTFKNATSGNPDDIGLGIDALQFGGELAGVPGTDQLAKTARYVRAAQKGKVQGPNAWDAFVGSPQRH